MKPRTDGNPNLEPSTRVTSNSTANCCEILIGSRGCAMILTTNVGSRTAKELQLPRNDSSPSTPRPTRAATPSPANAMANARAPISVDLDAALFAAPRSKRSVSARGGSIALGRLLVGAGLALMPAPILPGFPLTIAGVLLLASSSSRARNLLNKSERWLPRWMRVLLRRVMRQHARASKKNSATPPTPPTPSSR